MHVLEFLFCKSVNQTLAEAETELKENRSKADSVEEEKNRIVSESQKEEEDLKVGFLTLLLLRDHTVCTQRQDKFFCKKIMMPQSRKWLVKLPKVQTTLVTWLSTRQSNIYFGVYRQTTLGESPLSFKKTTHV